MKTPVYLLVLLSFACLLLAAGCKKRSGADASAPLQQSFQTAEPEVQKAIVTVTARLNSGDYTEATKALAPVVTRRPLTPPQREAVGIALQQINQAIAANPALNTKEMYELRKQMFDAVHRGPRF
jgi:hypothetical protein